MFPFINKLWNQKKKKTSQTNPTKKRPQKPPTPARWRGRHTSEGWECLFTVRWIEAKTFAARPKALANLSAAAPPPGWITVANKGPYFMYLYIYIYFFFLYIFIHTYIYIYGFAIPRNLSKCFMSSWWWRLHRWWVSSKAYPPMNLQGPPEKKKCLFGNVQKSSKKTRKHALLTTRCFGWVASFAQPGLQRESHHPTRVRKSEVFNSHASLILHRMFILTLVFGWVPKKKNTASPELEKMCAIQVTQLKKKICQPRNKPAKQGCSDSCSILCHLTVVVLSGHFFFVVTYRHHHTNCEARVCYERTSIAKYAPDITSKEAFSAAPMEIM